MDKYAIFLCSFGSVAGLFITYLIVDACCLNYKMLTWVKRKWFTATDEHPDRIQVPDNDDPMTKHLELLDQLSNV